MLLSTLMKDTVRVTDSITVVKSTNPSVIKEELVTLLDSVDKDVSNGKLITIYVILQVYIENHFHYYLRFLIGDGFSSSKRIPCWREKDGVPNKLQCFETVLMSSNIKYDSDLLASVVSKYTKLTTIRNAMAHGHPLTETIAEGKKSVSKAMQHLDADSLQSALTMVNELMSEWNTFMESLENQELAFKSSPLPEASFIKNCKFPDTFTARIN